MKVTSQRGRRRRPRRGVRVGRPGRGRPRQGQPDLQQRRRGARRHHRGDVLRGLRVAHGHQLLGRRARHQGVPAAPHRVGRGPHREPLERVRPARASRRSRRTTPPSSASAASPTPCASSSTWPATACRAPPSTRVASRPTSLATPAWTTASPASPAARRTSGTDFDKVAMTTPGEGGSPDPQGGRAQPPPGPHRPRRQGPRPDLAAARRGLPAHHRARAPAAGADDRCRPTAGHGGVGGRRLGASAARCVVVVGLGRRGGRRGGWSWSSPARWWRSIRPGRGGRVLTALGRVEPRGRWWSW